MTDPRAPRTRSAEVRAPTPPTGRPPTQTTLAEVDDPLRPRAWRVSIDRGGTFTDIVATAPDGRVVVRKVSTDPSDADGDAALDAIRELVGVAPGAKIPATLVSEVRVGTTVATNALLERRGERCALFVTKGFRDMLAIGTQERPDLFALEILKTLPLPEAVYEIPERVLVDGTVDTPLDLEAVFEAVLDAEIRGIRSVAVVFLHAYAHPAHEQLAGDLLRGWSVTPGPDGAATRLPPDPRFDVFLSHESARELGAVSRGETTATDAYLTPVVRRSLERFRAGFAYDVVVHLVRSDGGLSLAAQAHGPAAVLSGPAGGALAVERIARVSGFTEAIGFDMGGTSTDVCRVAPEADRRYETRAAGFRLRVPSLRVHTVAAGGGSILSFDGRRMRVGPESAGAHPGPAGYGRGGPATLTDADAVLGRLVPDAFPRCFGADGTSQFDVVASWAAIEPLARAAGLSVEAAAAGFVRIADEHVAQAIREESVLRGFDVRTHALVAFGGAGPQHACAVARALGVRTIVVPRLASVLSAWGIAGARWSKEWVEPILGPLDGHALARIARAGVAEHARHAVVIPGSTFTLRKRVEMRVRGTDTALEVDASDDALAELRPAFDEAHRRAYGFPPPEGAEVEVVNVRMRIEEEEEERRKHVAGAIAAERSDGLESDSVESVARMWEAIQAAMDRTGVAPVWFELDGGLRQVLTPVVALQDLRLGRVGRNALMLVDPTMTIVVEPGWRITVRPEAIELKRVGGTQRTAASAARDPVSLALFANAFMSVAERMGAVLERTSHSTNIKERLDFSCAVFDGEGRLVANAPHIPVHLGAMGESVRAVIEARGPDLREGDAIVTNDPYRGGSHLPDITVVTPVAVENGRARFFVANRAHHADVGGITPGSMPPLSTSIDDEGIRLHDVLLVRDGVLREDEIRAALASGPHPARKIDERLFDFRAQAAANHEGAKLLREMCDAQGAEVVAAYMGHVQDDGAAAFEEVLAALPQGTHRADDTLDDGTPLRVAITIDGGRAVVDFAGTGPASAGNLNAPRAVTRAAVLYAFRTLVRRPIPLNEGCLRPLDIRIPDGSLLAPEPPAAVVGGNVETSQRIVDLVLRALGVQAGSQGTMNNTAFGTDRWTYYETIGGGTGAGPTFDGASAVQCHMTNTRITDVEVLEHRFPVVLRKFAIRRGSGGAGRHRGGDGIVREIEFREAVKGGVLSERRSRGAPGLDGGADGAPGRNTVVRGGVETSVPGRAELTMDAGDLLRIETPGGGGYGRA